MLREIAALIFLVTYRQMQWVRRLGRVALVIGFTTQCAWAQPVISSPEPARQTSENGAASSNSPATSVRAGSNIQTPKPPVSEAQTVPVISVEILAQRIDILAKTIESAASTPKPPLADPWQDIKSIVLNVISNRIDSWLFGDGNGNVGYAAQVVAVLALTISVIRFMLAVAMLNPATPPPTINPAIQ